MPRFYFDLSNGVIEEDLDGIELSDRKEARSEAVRLGGELVLEHAEDLLREGVIRVNVTDVGRKLVCSVRIQVVEETSLETAVAETDNRES